MGASVQVLLGHGARSGGMALQPVPGWLSLLLLSTPCPFVRDKSLQV